MRYVFSLAALVSLWFACSPAHAQTEKPLIPLQLDGDPQPVQIPARAMLYSPQCDGSGAIYVRYSPVDDDNHPAKLVRVETDGTTKGIPPVSLPNPAGDTHVFLFAAGNDDSLHEIMRVPIENDSGEADNDIRYVTFDKDGSLNSQSTFEDDFIPSTLVPLPSGDFFAAGVVLNPMGEGLTEGPIAGIFGSDGRLKRRLQNTESGLVNVTDEPSNPSDNSNDLSLEGAVIRLGGDGNLYVLLPGDTVRVEVVSQAGHVLRQMELEQPFANSMAEDMLLSGNRLVVVYEGEAGGAATLPVYVLYDAQSGEIIRQYQPEFSGTVACFEDGQTLTLLMRQPSSGAMAIAQAELQ